MSQRTWKLRARSPVPSRSPKAVKYGMEKLSGSRPRPHIQFTIQSAMYRRISTWRDRRVLPVATAFCRGSQRPPHWICSVHHKAWLVTTFLPGQLTASQGLSKLNPAFTGTLPLPQFWVRSFFSYCNSRHVGLSGSLEGAWQVEPVSLTRPFLFRYLGNS